MSKNNDFNVLFSYLLSMNLQVLFKSHEFIYSFFTGEAQRRSNSELLQM